MADDWKVLSDLERLSEKEPLEDSREDSEEEDEQADAPFWLSPEDRKFWLAGAIARKAEERGLISTSDSMGWDFQAEFGADMETADAERAEQAVQSPQPDSADASPSDGPTDGSPGESASGGEAGTNSQGGAASGPDSGGDSGTGFGGVFGGGPAF